MAAMAMLALTYVGCKGQEEPEGEGEGVEVVADEMPETMTLKVGDAEFSLSRVDAGTFTIGPVAGDKNVTADEKPAHKVDLTQRFYIGQTEVTQELYKAVMGTNPSKFSGANLPVEQVSYNDAMEFCKRLSEQTGRTFTLPTEAQWEYAAYGGHRGTRTLYSGSDNIGTVGCYIGNAPDYLVFNTETNRYDTIRHTIAVAQKQPNVLGIYDMTGNVREWCADAWGPLSEAEVTDPVCTHGGERVYRGGCCNDSAQYCRAAYREAISPSSKGFSIGFRLAINME